MRTTIHTACRRCGQGAWQVVEGDSIEELVEATYEAAVADILAEAPICKCLPVGTCGCKNGKQFPEPSVAWVEPHFN
jgi:hypothetical protein